MDIERAQKLITQSLVKETVKRLNTYLEAEGNPKIDRGLLMASRTVAATACLDTADFLRGDIVMTTLGDARNATKAEEKVPVLEAEVQALRNLVPKTKLRAHDEGKLLKEGKSD